jgi:glycosyltransferase involved in cell wall biosynthesis
MGNYGRDVSTRIGRLIVRNLVVKDFGEFRCEPIRGRALVAYLAFPLIAPRAFRDRVKFSNRGIAQEIVRALNELGYVVDVINFDNMSWVPKRQYDLFIGHAAANFAQLASQLPSETVRIYFATGMYWREANERLARRLHDLALRRGVSLPANRAASEGEEEANRLADGIICVGNAAVAKSYSTFAKVVALNNGVYPITWQGWQKKDFEAGRKHFLFFAGRGNVLKGLDLLLDAFCGTDMHLHICQHIESEFWSAYEAECRSQPNIHVYGNVKMRSARFESLAARCNWIISATCTEGQPGAILECMGYGLIPILPDAANIDMDREWGLRIERCEVEAIREVARAACEMDPEQCQRMAEKAVEVVQKGYAADGFRRHFKDAIRAVVEGREPRKTNGVG